MITSLGGTVDEEAAIVEARWADLAAIPLGPVDARPQRSHTSRPRHDVLAEIPPPEYVEALTGVEVPHHGTIQCPLPDHDDRTPSCKVYDDPARGWFCFGCGRGGTIYDLAAHLWNMPTRGDAFRDLRRDLTRALLKGAA